MGRGFSLLAWTCALSGAVALNVAAQPAEETSLPLTASRVIELASTCSPEARIAAARVEEARGRLTSARVFSQENPVLEALSGRSWRGPAGSTELELAVPLGYGLGRAYRVQEATATVERETLHAADARRLLAGRALASFYRVLHAEMQLGIAEEGRRLAGEQRRIAEEKVEAGDAARLELLVAETEVSRGESAAESAAGELALAQLELAAVLGMPSSQGLRTTGDLADRSRFDAIAADGRTAGERERADLRAARADLAAAAASLKQARAAWIPGIALRLSYGEDQEESTLRPGLAVSLPIFDQRRGERQQALARRLRAQIELEARRALAAVELEGAQAAYRRAAAAASEIEVTALPRALETEALALAGYEAGKFDLPALLIVRRNALETRREQADRLLSAALAGVDLAVAAGALP